MASNPAEYGVLLGAVGTLSTLVMFAVEIAFAVVVATIVRRERPDALGVFIASIVCDGFGLFLGIASGLLMVLAGSGESGMYAMVGANLFVTILRVAARTLLIVGVVRLARQPPEKAPWP